MAISITCRDLTVSEADGFAEFVIQLDGPSTSQVSVDYSTVGLGASSSLDYTAITGTLTFAPGVTVKTLRVPLKEDSGIETAKSLALSFSNPVNAVLTDTQAVATIIDNDTAATATSKATLSVHDVVVDEKAGTVTFDIVLDRAVGESFTVAYSTGGGTALDGLDYDAGTGTVTFTAGQTVKHVTINLLDDNLAEFEETFNLNLGDITGAAAGMVQVGDGMGTATIGRSDLAATASPYISASDIIVGEADGYAEFVVRLNAPASGEVKVNYSVTGLGAGSQDYRFLKGTLTFEPGVTTQTVRIALGNDLDVEALKSFALNLGGAVGGTVADAQAIATIVDNDTDADAGSKANLSVRDVVVDEAAGTVTFAVVLDKAVSDVFSVAYATAGATAVSGADFTAASGTLTFAAGQTVQHVTVSLSNDAAAELEELFHLNLGAVTGSGKGLVQVGDGQGTAMIGRSDLPVVDTPTVGAKDIVVGEADGYVEFVVQLSAPSSGAVSVAYRVDGLGASSQTDYNGASGVLQFAPGQTTQTIRIALDDDTTPELLESLGLSLSNAVGAVLSDDRAVATIVDNDTIADATVKANLSVSDVTVDEKAGTVTFDIVLDKAVGEAFSVTYATAAGSALPVSDFTAASGTLTFVPGQTVQHVTINIADDAVSELEELFHLNLGTVSGAGGTMVQIADPSGTATIGRSDQPDIAKPFISVSDIMAGEGDGYAEFVVRLSAPGTQQVSVTYQIDSLGASDFDDYSPASGTLVFAPGVTTQVVRVPLHDSATREGMESFALSLSAPVNAVLAETEAVATIVDNDTLATSTAKATLSVNDVHFDEAAGTVTFDIILDKAVDGAFNVSYSTASGTALAGSDFLSAVGTISFVPGQTVQHVTVRIADDAAPELEEQFTLNLTGVTGSAKDMVQIGDGTGTGVIGRSDLPAVATPAINVEDVMVDESDGYAEFVVKLSAPATGLVSVKYSVESLGAKLYTDYFETDGTLTFAPGTTTQTVRIPLGKDGSVEMLESLALNLSGAVGAVLADDQAIATIVDNDTAAATTAKANLSVRDVVVDEKAGTATFELVLDKALSDGFTVAYSTTNGSALAGFDYTATGGTISFGAGQTVQHVTVNINDEAAAEADEVFHLKLGALSGTGKGMVQITDGVGTATIGANDGAAVATPTITASNVSVTEADGFLEFVVQLSAPGSSQVSVNYRIDSLGATAGVDYQATAGTLVFAPGVTTQVVRVAIGNDTILDANESLALTLSSPVNATLPSTQAVGTIYEDDLASGRVMIYGKGDDTYVVTSRNDIIVEQAGGGTDTVQSSVSYVLSSNLENLRLTGTGSINATGNALNNVIWATNGTNVIDGGAGVDTLSYANTTTTSTVGVTLDLSAKNALGVSIASGVSGRDQVKNIENLIGSRYRDTLTGDAGANILDGGAGADKLSGGLGNDTYYVDYTGDVVVESADARGGVDTVISRVSWTLGAYQENLVLEGSNPLNGTGNDLANVITGNAGNNVLDGRGGEDRMFGGLGNDTYYVDNVKDGVVESGEAKGGIDTVISTVSYTLGNYTENLTLAGTAAIDGKGNTLNNTITGNAAANVLNGGAGADTMTGGLGNDTYYVDNAADVVVESSDSVNGGTDRVLSTVSYTLGAYVENLFLSGSAAINGTGNSLNNIIGGNKANNVLNGGLGADQMSGGLGNDAYYVDNAGDVVTEAANGGTDLVFATISYTLAANVENLRILGNGAINAVGNALNNTIYAGTGANIINGGSGTDTLSYIYATSSSASNTVGVTLDLSKVNASGYATASGISGADRVTRIENLVGSKYNDVFTGTAGANVLDGLAGADRLSGGLGNDTYYVDNAKDVVIESADSVNGGIDRVISTVSYTLSNYVENLTLSGTAAINGSGNALANTLIGNNAANVLDGKDGGDTMSGGLGNDTYYVNSSQDVVIESSHATLGGTDTIISSVAYTLGDYQENLTLSGTAALNGTGNTLANTITGNAGANVLSGGGGNDVLIGGAGRDTLKGGSGKDIFRFDDMETGATSTTADRIVDFVRGQDKIDLRLIDANTAHSGNDAFTKFISGSSSFTAAGQLKFANGVLYGNTDGDSAAEFAIVLTGVSTLTMSDIMA